MHAEYCDRAYHYDKPFETDKQHWLVIGNSFGRDFVNVILESDIADNIEVSYIFADKSADIYHRKQEYSMRFTKANRVFVCSKGLNEDLVGGIEVLCMANGYDPKNLVIVGEKTLVSLMANFI